MTPSEHAKQIVRDWLESSLWDGPVAVRLRLEEAIASALAQNWENWLPTAANINALPEPVRSYIHQLETSTIDPAGDTAKRVLGEDTIQQLSAALVEEQLAHQETRGTVAAWKALRTWECGCGCINGVNLAECGLCRRARSEGDRGGVPTPPTWDEQRDAKRYRRLRILGCAPVDTVQLEDGTVIRCQALDAFIDADLRLAPSREKDVQAMLTALDAANSPSAELEASALAHASTAHDDEDANRHQWDKLTPEARRVRLRAHLLTPAQVETLLTASWEGLPDWLRLALDDARAHRVRDRIARSFGHTTSGIGSAVRA